MNCLLSHAIVWFGSSLLVAAIPQYKPPKPLSFTPRYPSGQGVSPITRCKEQWRETTLDHFSWAIPDGNITTFRQRYFVCDEFWQRPTASNEDSGPIFFYLGNEADVTLYLNATGLMWESAPEFGALLVFAEHRYYGLSKPYHPAKKLRKHMQFLSSHQAMADYAELLFDLKLQLGAPHAPVIGFGGSYGGMLAAWMRMKYPHVLDGAVAASAPIWTFEQEEPAWDAGSYAKIITYAASKEAGSAAACVDNNRKAWKAMFAMSHNQAGRDQLHSAARLCSHSKVESVADVWGLAYWAQSAWDYMAMGNFPYASTYILNGRGELPAWPIKVACSKLADPALEGAALVGAMMDAIGVFYNFSSDLPCFDFKASVNKETAEDSSFWDWQWCTEQFMPMSRDGGTLVRLLELPIIMLLLDEVHDMFWRQDFDEGGAIRECQQQWGVTPRPLWPTISYGARKIAAASNIVFSNGQLDPWSGGGVLQNVTDQLPAILIQQAAHHLDLMWSHPEDTVYVQQARAMQRSLIWDWVAAARTHNTAAD